MCNRKTHPSVLSSAELAKLVCAALALGCAVEGGNRWPGAGLGDHDTNATEGSSDTGDGTDHPSDGGDSGGEGDDGGEDDDGADDGADDDGTDIRFDVYAPEDDSGGGTSDENVGCGKVDFLFVIDNSGSMEDEHNALIASFPGFISAIRDTLQVDDFQIMVVDTDGASSVEDGGNLHCQNPPECCVPWCAVHPAGLCNGDPCPPIDPCEALFASGRLESGGGTGCEVVGPNRYMTGEQPDLDGTFACLANVGTAGEGDERPMEAMVKAVTIMDAAGQCNEGFVRDDAVLVATLITDEEDDGKSPGNPDSWRSDILFAKHGDDKALVVLALVGDTDLPGGLCEPYEDSNGDGAEDAPRLREFAESFEFGQWGSVCAMSYAPFFEQAVSVIDTACDEFEPPP